MNGPRIALNCDLEGGRGGGAGKAALNCSYVEAVVRAGGLPVLLPPILETELVAELLDAVDGLVLTGGRDYDPALYGEEPHPATRLLDARRMGFDLALARAACARALPTLGICGGMQLINVACGGSLVQDIASQVPGARRHTRDADGEAFHQAVVLAGSRLAAIVGAGPIETNSSHHQAVGRPGAGLRVVAWASEDRVVEAVEGAGRDFLLGVQWHPERLLDRDVNMGLFRALVVAARGR